jgi:hypothetical protein
VKRNIASVIQLIKNVKIPVAVWIAKINPINKEISIDNNCSELLTRL